MADYGMKITKPGFDISDADEKDFIINSKLNSLKVFSKGSVTISVSAYTGSGGTGSTNVAHGLGYEPFYVCYFKLKHSTKIWLQDSFDTSVIPTNFIAGHAYSNATNLNLNVNVTGANLAAFTATGYYYIFVDKAIE